VPTHLFLCWVGQGSLRSDIEGRNLFFSPSPFNHPPPTLPGRWRDALPPSLRMQSRAALTHVLSSHMCLFWPASCVCVCVCVGVSVGGGLCL
jgi:hypothetical protein